MFVAIATASSLFVTFMPNIGEALRPFLFIVGLVFCFLFPELGLYLLFAAIIFSPEFILGWLEERELSFRIGDILIIGALFGLFSRVAISRRNRPFISTPLNVPILVFIIVMLLSTANGILCGYVSVLRGTLFFLKRLEYFLIFFLVVNIVQNPNQIKKYLTFLLACGFLVALNGLHQVIMGYKGSITSFFGKSDANSLAYFLNLNMLLVIGIDLNTDKIKYKILVFTFSAASFVCLIYTQSQSGYLSLFLTLIIMGIVTRRSRLIIVALLLGFVALNIFGPDIHDLTVQILGIFPQSNIFNPSWDVRINAWKDYLGAIIRSSPIGMGLGAVYLGWVDNYYIHEMLETGILGLAVAVWMFLIIFRSLFRAYKISTGAFSRALFIGLLGGFMSLLISAIASENFYTLRTMEPFWSYMGLVMVLRNLQLEEKFA